MNYLNEGMMLYQKSDKGSLEEKSCQISFQFDLKWLSLGFFWRASPEQEHPEEPQDAMSSDMGSVPGPKNIQQNKFVVIQHKANNVALLNAVRNLLCEQTAAEHIRHCQAGLDEPHS